MPDITMCSGEKCEKRQKCHRFTAKPYEVGQSWFLTPPFKEDGTCEHFWANDGRRPKKEDAMT